MNENILHLALASLPVELLQDRFFENLCNTIPIEFKVLGAIEIEEKIYLTYKNIVPELVKYFSPIKGKDKLLNLMFIYPNYILSINIAREEKAYLIKYVTNNDQEKIIITCKKEENHTQVKIVTITKKDSVIIKYLAQVYDYDKDYKKVDNPNSITEILKDFSNLFYVPFELSYYYYANFSKYYQFLHKNRIINEIKLDEQTRPMSEIYTFIEPMSLNDFKDFLYAYTGKITKYQMEKISRILNVLELKIKDNYLVLSRNLFESILKYIIGYTADIILSHGVIITKEEKNYGFYQTLITNGKVEIDKKLITESQAQELFHLSKQNEESELLKEFFGISPTR